MKSFLFIRSGALLWVINRTVLLSVLVLAVGIDLTQASETEDGTLFDPQYLQTRGIDPKVAAWFRKAPRFAPGESLVTLKINGKSKGKLLVSFDEEGEPCMNTRFLQQAGLIPDTSHSNNEQSCQNLKERFAQTTLDADPTTGTLALVVPPEAVSSISDTTNWQHGGSAGLLNYNAQYMQSSGQASSTNFLQLSSEAGFNAADWIFRSQQSFSRFNGKEAFQHQSAYLQRTFSGRKEVLQAGKIILANSLFGAGQVLGFQFFPEQALLSQEQSAALVEGVADTQSVVEVRQSGVLLFSSTIPAGPFRLQGFSLLNTRSDLAVTLTGIDGSKRQFTVPASVFLLSGGLVAKGLSFGIGKIQQTGTPISPWLATASQGWQVLPRVGVNAGVLASSPWQALAAGVDFHLNNNTLLSGGLTSARDAKHQQHGIQSNWSVSQTITEQLSLSFNTSYQTSGYRELSDALASDTSNFQGRTRNQYGVGIGWASPIAGSLSLSWAENRTFEGQSLQYLRAGWSRQFSNVLTGLSIDRDLSHEPTSETRVYFTLSFPLGENGGFSSWLNHSQTNQRSGIRYSSRSSQDRNWNVSMERDSRTGYQSAAGNMNMVTPISQFAGSISRDNDRYTSWSGSANGGVIAHRHGITFSPYQIGDTFGIAHVGEEAGVRIETPAGPTWTDWRGYAVLPSLGAYRRSHIELDTRSLDRSTDVANAWQETEAARGAISFVRFDVVRSRRVLMNVLDAQSKPLPPGTGVFDENDQFISVTAADGSIFIPDVKENMTLTADIPGQSSCVLTPKLPENPPQNQLYETINMTCH